jgi:methionine synthase II (cobalamin-independent)
VTGPLQPLSAQTVGSYSKPAWPVGVNNALRVRRFDPSSHWQPAPELLAGAQQDAARLAIYEQELAGMAVVTDGEMFRHTYDTSFLLRMSGADTRSRRQRPLPPGEIPTVTRVARNPAEEDEERSAPKTVASKPVKVAVVGPFTASRRVVNWPSMSDAQVADSAVTGISLAYSEPGHSPQLLRACGTKHVLPGMLKLISGRPDTAAEVAARIRQAATIVPPDRLHPSVDCCMWFMPRALAFAKLRALGEATAQVRNGCL